MYAVGDVTSVGTPKAGVFAEGQAEVVADAIIAAVRGSRRAAQYDGRGICYLEFGHDQVAKVDVTFLSGQAPHGELEGPSSRSPPTRPRSAPAASGAGSAASGPTSRVDRFRPRRPGVGGELSVRRIAAAVISLTLVSTLVSAAPTTASSSPSNDDPVDLEIVMTFNIFYGGDELDLDTGDFCEVAPAHPFLF